MTERGLDASGDALAHLLTGTFALCVEIAADINVTIIMEEMGCVFGPPVDEGPDNANDNADGIDNDNDNVSDNLGTVSVIRVTTDPGNELDPQWDPASETIAFQTDRAPGGDSIRNVGSVQSDGSAEGIMASGPNSGFGIGGPMAWVGSTGLLIVNERVVFHEYMTFDTNQAPFTRTVNDGDDEAFTRELLIPGGGGGDTVTTSRDGTTVLWRFSTNGGAGTASLRTAPLSSLTGQDADEVGTVLFTDSDEVVHMLKNGVALTPDGSQVVISLPSGEGADLFLYDVSDPPVLVRQLTTSGASTGVNNAGPDVSPDGTRVAFGRAAQGEDVDVYMIGIDGTGLTRLTSTGRSENEPSWSPDGTRIAYQRADDDGWNIYVLTLGTMGPEVECGSDGDCDPGEMCVDSTCVPVDGNVNDNGTQNDNDNAADNENANDNDNDNGNVNDNGTAPEGFTRATITHRGSERVVAGPDVDPAVSTPTPAGYGVIDLALSGDGQKIWFVLYDQFPNVEGDPQAQVWSVNADGSGGVRSAIPISELETNSSQMLYYARTTLDGSIGIFSNGNGDLFAKATPGGTVQKIADAQTGGFPDAAARGAFRVSDDGSRLVFVDWWNALLYQADLTASTFAATLVASAGDFSSFNGIAGRGLEAELDISSTGSTWLVHPFSWDGDAGRNRLYAAVGSGFSSPTVVYPTLPSNDHTAFDAINMTDDGSTIGYVLLPEGSGIGGWQTYVQTVGSGSPRRVGYDIVSTGALVIADDGSRAHLRTNISHDLSSTYGFFEDLQTGEKTASGTQRFSGTSTPSFGIVRLSDDGTVMASAVAAGLYVLHDGVDGLPEFPSIDNIYYRFDDDACSMTVRVEVTAPNGVERIFTLPLYDGVDPSFQITNDEYVFFRDRSGGGVNWSTVFTEIEPGIWEREVFLFDGQDGLCAKALLNSSYTLRIILVDANATQSVFQDFAPVP